MQGTGLCDWGTAGHGDRATETQNAEPRHYGPLSSDDYGDQGLWGTQSHGDEAVGTRGCGGQKASNSSAHNTPHSRHQEYTERGGTRSAPSTSLDSSVPTAAFYWLEVRSGEGGKGDDRKCCSAHFLLRSVVPMRKRTAAAVRTGRKRGRRAWGGGVQRGLRRSGASPALPNTSQCYLSHSSSSHLEPPPLSLSYPLIPIAPLPLFPIVSVPHCLPHPHWPQHPIYLPLLPSFHIAPPYPSLPQDPPPSPPPRASHCLRMALTVSPSPPSVTALNTQLQWGRPQVGSHHPWAKPRTIEPPEPHLHQNHPLPHL